MQTDMAPVQRYGKTTDGRHWYFRARWDTWNFGIADDPDKAIRVAFEDEPGDQREARYGECGGCDASYMPLDKAERIIDACLRSFGTGREV